jgi:hypothetical protein
MIILLGGIVVEIGLVGIFLVFILNQTNLGIRLSASALSAAHAGLNEALIRILRNQYSPEPASYSLTVGDASAQFVICNGGFSCNAIDPDPAIGQVGIASTGSIFTKSRKLIAIVERSPETHAMKVISIEEKSL